MKYSLIATIVVLALAQGSFAQEATDVEKITQYFEEMKDKMAKELTAIVSNQDLSSQAQTFLQDQKTQLEPLAAQIEEQLKSASATVEKQILPLAENVKAQIEPMIANFQTQMEELFKKLTDQTKAIAN